MDESNIGGEPENFLGQGNGSFSLDAPIYQNRAHNTDFSDQEVSYQIKKPVMKPKKA